MMLRRLRIGLLAGLLASTAIVSPAHAGPLIPAIGAVVGFISSLGVVGQIVFQVGLSIGLSYLAKALAPKPQTPDISQLPGGTSGKLQAAGTLPRSFIVGRGMTAGSLVYANTYSASSAAVSAQTLIDAGIVPWAVGPVNSIMKGAGNTPNAYLVQVIALSDIPVAGLAGILVNGTAVTWNTGGTEYFEGFAIPEYNSGGTDYLWVRFYDGTQTQVDPTLNTLFGSDANRPYGTDRIGTGVAYAVVTALVNDKLFSGFPQFKFVLDGIKLYDRRLDSSAGGSGTQRWSDPTTWALTANPSTIIENILRGISYSGTWLYGAQTVGSAQLPSASWFAAQNECDTAISLDGGGTEAQFAVGGEIRLDTQPADTIDELLKACNGKLAEIGGAYKMRAGAAGSSVFSFTDDDILSTEKQTFDPFPNLQQTINAVSAKYVSPDEGWNAKDAPPLYDTSLEAADGGRRLPVAIDYSFVTSGTRVQRLMKSARDTERAFRHHALPMPPDAFVLEPLDVISWTSTRNGYTSKLFDVLAIDDLPNLNIGLSAKEVDPNAYDWTPATDEKPVSNGTIVVERPAAQPIVDWNATAYSITTDSGQKIPAIQLTWDPNTDDVDGVHFEVRLKSDATVILRDGFTDAVKAGSVIISQNLSFNTQYEARGQYIPHSSRDVTWSGWLSVTTPDDRVTAAAFEAGLHDYVMTQLSGSADAIDALTQRIALYTSEQDAQNLLDKYDGKVKLDEVRVDLASTDAQVVVLQQQRITDQEAFASYQITVAAQFTSVNSDIATAQATAIQTAQTYADGAIATYGTQADAKFATQTSLSSGLAGTLASAKSYADSAVATYATLASTTYATQTALTSASASTLASAESYADHSISVYDQNVQATYSTKGQTSSAVASALTAAESYADHAVSTLATSISATYTTQTSTASQVATAKAQAISSAEAYADSAVAQLNTSLSASIGSTNTSVSTNASAIATLNGFAAAAWAVKLNANGYVSGIQLVNGGSGSSYFQISADVFQVAWPGYYGLTPVFQIANVGGVAKISFRGDMFADGTITAQALSVGTLSAISANFGSATFSGAITSANGKLVIDCTNNRIVISD